MEVRDGGLAGERQGVEVLVHAHVPHDSEPQGTGEEGIFGQIILFLLALGAGHIDHHLVGDSLLVGDFRRRVGVARGGFHEVAGRAAGDTAVVVTVVVVVMTAIFA